MDAIFRKVLSLQEKGEDCAVATLISVKGSTPRGAGARMIVKQSGEVMGSIGGGRLESLVIREAKKAIEEGFPRKVTFKLTEKESQGIGSICGGTAEVYVEPVISEPTLLIVGAGHVGLALSTLAKMTGFRIVVTDDRRAFASRKRFPDADEIIVVKPEKFPEKIKIGRNTFVALVPRGHELDLAYLVRLLREDAAYIGMIGSRRKTAIIKKKLKEKGFSKKRIDKVFTPIGLAIGAETPEEIAVSILAEIIAVRRGLDSPPGSLSRKA